jgi:TRAP transporter 4TM/12TM fusion protein
MITLFAVLFSMFHLYTSGIREFPAMQQRLVHLTLGLMIVFLVCPFGKRKGEGLPGITDIGITLISMVVGGYLLINSEAIAYRLGNTNRLDIVAGGLLIILVLEGARRVMGWPLPLMAITAIFYALFGDRFPVVIAHGGFDATRIISHFTLTTEGIFGIPLGASATVVVTFIIFTSFLNGMGTGQYFIDAVMSRFGKTRGGAAKAAVVGSALMGTLTGSVIANVMGSGTFTIPLMKENGYSHKTAAAVEAVSSTGGQIMPPVMGAAAYIIAEFLRIPFVMVMKAALIPAFLYYLAEFIFVDLEAVKLRLTGFSEERVAAYREKAKGKGYLILPILMLILLMVALEWSPTKAAFYSIVLAFIIGLIQPENRLNIKRLIEILKSAAINTIEVIMATACAGIIIGSLSLTGLGIQLSTLLINLAGGNLILLLVLTMVVSLILGMGLTTTACYVILAVLVAPSLIKMGIQPLASHFFVFFFGMYSFITPPVALGAYAAASLAGAEPFATGYAAWRIALPAFIVPYIFVYSPALLGFGTAMEVIFAVVTACAGVLFMTVSTVGYFLKSLAGWQRFIMLAAGIMLIIPGHFTDVPGIIMGLVVITTIIWSKRNDINTRNER